VGLWNTYGSPTLFFPDPANRFGIPCGAWLELRNAMVHQGFTVERVDVRFRIPGALRYRHYPERLRDRLPPPPDRRALPRHAARGNGRRGRLR
jgi:hypothetical protein